MTPFAAAVAAVEHREDCATNLTRPRCLTCGLKQDGRDACTCDRDARIARGLAAAAQVAAAQVIADLTYHLPPTWQAASIAAFTEAAR